MASNTSIEWASDTWNPWYGCKKISPGCKNCYMYRDKKRYGQDPTEIVRSKTKFNDPLTKLQGPFVFTCSWSDFFLEQADDWRNDAWDIIRKTPHLTYQILTKRPENIIDRLSDNWGDGLANVWLGVSVENNDYRYRMDVLRDIPATIRFVSVEPLLGPVTLNLAGFQWVITGGESGPGFRPANFEWFRDVREQCLKADVAYFHKQHGGTRKIDGAWGGRVLDGQKWSQYPRGFNNGNSK